MSKQPEALLMADALERLTSASLPDRAAAELRRLHAVEQEAETLREVNAQLLEALNDASKQTRHPDYDWPLWLSKTVDAAIAAAEAA